MTFVLAERGQKWYNKTVKKAQSKVTKRFKRTPKNYDGTSLTSHSVSEILPFVLNKVNGAFKERPDLILSAWPEVIGSKLSGMTQAASFVEGVLTIKVHNSTLHSLLSQNEKQRLLQILRDKFPKVQIKNILFRIG